MREFIIFATSMKEGATVQNLTELLKNQIRIGARQAGEKLISASQAPDFNQAEQGIDEGRDVLGGTFPIRNVINLISKRIDEIEKELKESGAALPEDFKLELSIIYGEWTNKEETLGAVIV